MYENYKILLRERKAIINGGYVIPIKIPGFVFFLVEADNLILKFRTTCKGLKIDKVILKNNKLGGL